MNSFSSLPKSIVEDIAELSTTVKSAYVIVGEILNDYDVREPLLNTTTLYTTIYKAIKKCDANYYREFRVLLFLHHYPDDEQIIERIIKWYNQNPNARIAPEILTTKKAITPWMTFNSAADIVAMLRKKEDVWPQFSKLFGGKYDLK